MRTLRFTDIKLSLGNAVVLDPYALGDEIESKYDKKCLFCTAQKWSFPLRIPPVNVTKFTGNCGFGHIYWRNP